MTPDLKRMFAITRLRYAFYLFLVAAAVIAVLGAIGSSRAVAQRASGLASPEDENGDRNDTFAVAGPTPPVCHHFLITILDENFDGVAPPILPSGWTATNGIDPDGILWQTSNSGMPSPPSDTVPNAAWVNCPAVVSDKYLDSPMVFATESTCVWPLK